MEVRGEGRGGHCTGHRGHVSVEGWALTIGHWSLGSRRTEECHNDRCHPHHGEHASLWIQAAEIYDKCYSFTSFEQYAVTMCIGGQGPPWQCPRTYCPTYLFIGCSNQKTSQNKIDFNFKLGLFSDFSLYLLSLKSYRGGGDSAGWDGANVGHWSGDVANHCAQVRCRDSLAPAERRPEQGPPLFL